MIDHHVDRLAAGLQDLLCEGRFVDVRICCSDHGPSDGLGAHRAMLAAASPGLLAPNLHDDDHEDEMVCVHLPDYTSTCVASVLSILYYGETWVHSPHQQNQVSTINSLLLNLGVSLEVARDGDRIFLRKKHLENISSPNVVRRSKVKKEPSEMISAVRIKKEKFERSVSNTRPVFPTVESGSLFKCPHDQCSYCSLNIAEVQTHVDQCSLGETKQDTITHVDIKPSLMKKEPNIKQEPVDPLKQEILVTTAVESSVHTDHDYGDASEVVTVVSDNSGQSY